jgi:hypothetical protein
MTPIVRGIAKRPGAWNIVVFLPGTHAVPDAPVAIQELDRDGGIPGILSGRVYGISETNRPRLSHMVLDDRKENPCPSYR